MTKSSKILDQISSLYSGFTKTQQKIADKLLVSPEKVSDLSLIEMAKYLNVGEASIIRFCQRLGFTGFADFKLQFAIEIATLSTQSASILDTDINPTENSQDIAFKLQSLLNDVIAETVNLLDLSIVEQVAQAVKNANRLFLFGVGGSGLTAEDAKHKFMRIGFQVDALTNSHFMYMQAALLKPNDLVFGISYSGDSIETCHALKIAKQNGATIVALTHQVNSEIANLADYVLINGGRHRLKQGDSISTKIAQLFVLDLIYTLVVRSDVDSASENRQKTVDVILKQKA